MAAAITLAARRPGKGSAEASTEPRALRVGLTVIALVFIAAFLVLPVVVVLSEALSEGTDAFARSFTEPTTLAAIELTLTATLIAVPINAIFGIAAAWAVTRYQFRGKSVLVTLIDVPVTVSPVIAGMLFVLLFGGQTGVGQLLADLDMQVLFAPPAIVIATIFVTFPYVARELIPFWASQGIEEEQAAMVLGAGPFTTFRRITLPKAKWALMHGLVLSTARALGEFGAVSVVSGHIRGHTNTVPLTIEALYNEYRFADAFAVSTLLLSFAAVTLVLKRLIESRAIADGESAIDDKAEADAKSSA